MKSRFTIIGSLVVLITIISSLPQSARVQAQNTPHHRTYLPLIQTPGQHGVPRFETLDPVTTVPDGLVQLTINLFNDGPVSDKFTVSDVSDPARTLLGVRLDYYPHETFIYSQSGAEIRMSISTSPSTPFGTDTRVLRASAGGSSFAEVTITTIVAPLFPTHIRNGDFESGSTDWGVGYWEEFPDDTPNLPVIRREEDSHSGDWQMVLGGPPDSASSARQTISISPERPFLSYWYKIDGGAPYCRDGDPASTHDIAVVGLKLLVGTTLLDDAYDLCRANDTNGQWIHRVVDLREYSYQDLYISMVAINEAKGGTPSYLHIDDVELIAAP